MQQRESEGVENSLESISNVHSRDYEVLKRKKQCMEAEGNESVRNTLGLVLFGCYRTRNIIFPLPY